MANLSEDISVVVPCFNAGAYLDEAIESILGQTIRPRQVIVVDDGSTDDSAERARRHGPGVLCLRQANAGISAARNAGIAHATGSLIAFLDADDLWPADSISLRLAVLEREPEVTCVFGATEQFGETQEPGPTRVGRLISAMLARRWIVDHVGLFDVALRVGETLDWVARLDDTGLPVRSITDLVLRRRIHATNTVRDRAKHVDYLRALHASLSRRRARGMPS